MTKTMTPREKMKRLNEIIDELSEMYPDADVSLTLSDAIVIRVRQN